MRNEPHRWDACALVDRSQSVVGFVVGLVLCVAAIAKSLGPMSIEQVLLVSVEFALGLGIMVKSHSQWIWHAVVGLFALFSIVSFHRWQAGAATCGCFGVVEVRRY